MRTLTYTAHAADEGRAVKRIIRSKMAVSHGQLASLKQKNAVLLDGQSVHANEIVHAGQTISLLLADEEGGAAVPAEGDVNVVYEDEDILIVDKSAPLACMSGVHHPDDALENRLAWRYRGENYVFRPVNRLDKGTSGLMAVARHAHAQQVLQNMLHTDAYVREYLALAVGRVEPESGTIDAPIGKADGATVRREVRADGKRAVTHYETVARGENYTLLRVRLETGRTHQIRVHLQFIGHPIAGDFLYGEEDARLSGRFALHSARLVLTHPVTGERMAFESDAPRVFYDMLAAGSACFHFARPDSNV